MNDHAIYLSSRLDHIMVYTSSIYDLQKIEMGVYIIGPLQ
jgi:hypothetical protein